MSNARDTSVIPRGKYCYTPLRLENGGMDLKPCPYWSSNPDKPEQESGYCSFLGVGDWEEDGTKLLWDQVKECGESMEEASK